MSGTAPVNTARRRLLLAGAAALAAPALCQSAAPAPTAPVRAIIYYGDQRLTVPARIARIATTWEAQNAIIAMLGFGDRIVGTTRLVHGMPLFRRFVPSIGDATIIGRSSGAAGFSIETLLALRPDVLFTAGAPPAATIGRLNDAGIAVAGLRYNALEAMVERTAITGQILGEDAPDRARQFERYYRDMTSLVKERVAQVPAPERQRIYHAVGSPYMTSGRPSLNQDWIDIAGAINVAEQWFPPARPSGVISLEHLLAADPDVVLAMTARDAKTISEDPRWHALRAVRAGRVLVNPKGMFWWCRETSEGALQPLWLASTLYPDLFSDIDLRHETRRFYEQFYGYELDDTTITSFLSPTA
ncbi:ABC transporter substrate-binding protein [Achromobacter deleyi]|uniref:ABC transporter substrate-binding protein n=1 Tax=Achromobacter deleyi TaxID=1353891 RepID=UPI001492A9D4|nr:ABC transporter substrate-binding protein [Achromobacter deleyi]QVQ24705.1 ABC transporter substrate-binding protein [Achromobacter deleyi]UIP20241.1 ABC transporter substrate-binding protein [Achromobacter deleyi]